MTRERQEKDVSTANTEAATTSVANDRQQGLVKKAADDLRRHEREKAESDRRVSDLRTALALAENRRNEDDRAVAVSRRLVDEERRLADESSRAALLAKAAAESKEFSLMETQDEIKRIEGGNLIDLSLIILYSC